MKVYGLLLLCRYLDNIENLLQWMVLLLVLVALLPRQWLEGQDTGLAALRLQKHMAAFTFLFAFIQVRHGHKEYGIIKDFKRKGGLSSSYKVTKGV
jgi:hypothetical protein